MRDGLDVDPGLFGLWPKTALYDGFAKQSDDLKIEFGAEIGRIVLETKSDPDGAEDGEPDLHDLLNQLTRELAGQFRTFRTMRAEAEKLLSSSDDDAAIKAAKADIKAAADSMSVMVRTLEKIDALQRSLAHDRALATETSPDAAGYDDAKRGLLAFIDARAEERARILFDSWKAEALADADVTAARPPPG